MKEQHGHLIVLSGPAGSGKTTLAHALVAAFPNIRRAVTATTRKPRPGEVEGRDYYFFSREEFERLISEGGFYEYAEVHGRLYGTPKREVDERLTAGLDLLLVIDVQGAQAFRNAASQDSNLADRLHTVFVKPRDTEQIRARLVGRGSDDGAEICRRLQTALRELEHADAFDHIIVSGTREEDFTHLKEIYERINPDSASASDDMG